MAASLAPGTETLGFRCPKLVYRHLLEGIGVTATKFHALPVLGFSSLMRHVCLVEILRHALVHIVLGVLVHQEAVVGVQVVGLINRSHVRDIGLFRSPFFARCTRSSFPRLAESPIVNNSRLLQGLQRVLVAH